MKHNVIVTYSSIESALKKAQSEAEGRARSLPGGGLESPAETAAALEAAAKGPTEVESPGESQELTGAQIILLSKALREIESKDGGDGVLSTPTDPFAALLQSYLAEHADAKTSLTALQAGGLEAQFDERDFLGWVGGFFTWWRRIWPHDWIPAPANPTAMDNKVRIGLLADWGTGLYGAPECAKTMEADAKGFDIYMHLGDVYYSGTPGEINSRFLPYWPKNARQANLALNSNHEMYSGGYGYFDTLLPDFANRSILLKQKSSNFALRNDHFLLVGLDSGYNDHDLNNGQAKWLESLVNAAGNRKVILFSHHQPYSLYESQGPKMVERISEMLEQKRIFAWYFGHEHRLVIYDQHKDWGMWGRCIGHGGMPYFRDKFDGALANTTALYAKPGRQKDGIATPSGMVLDGPNQYVQGHQTKYGPNGYVILELDGDKLTESYRLPDGSDLRAPFVLT